MRDRWACIAGVEELNFCIYSWHIPGNVDDRMTQVYIHVCIASEALWSLCPSLNRVITEPDRMSPGAELLSHLCTCMGSS